MIKAKFRAPGTLEYPKLMISTSTGGIILATGPGSRPGNAKGIVLHGVRSEVGYQHDNFVDMVDFEGSIELENT